MRKLLAKMDSVKVGKKGAPKSTSPEETLKSDVLSQTVSAFDFNQEAKDATAAKVPAARNLTIIAATLLAVSGLFSLSAKQSESAAKDTLVAEQSRSSSVNRQISGLVGGDRTLPDHIQSRSNELSEVESYSTDANALWSTLLASTPTGVFLESVTVIPGESEVGTRDALLVATVSSGVQIVEWQNALTAHPDFSLSPEGVLDDRAPTVTATITLYPGKFVQKAFEAQETPTSDVSEVVDVSAEDSLTEPQEGETFASDQQGSDNNEE